MKATEITRWNQMYLNGQRNCNNPRISEYLSIKMLVIKVK